MAQDDEKTEVLPASAERAGPSRPSRPSGAGDERASLIDRSLGKFTVVELLGQGGSGEVYRAEQPQLGRSAVIKVLRREKAASPHRIERFLREAKLASRLDHPYAAHVYAFGAESDGVLWIAMEHVRGVTLDQLVVQRGPMPPAVFGPLFGRLCEVVHTAHELGIVHRDIKGSNVMVIERAGQLLPKLLDFGIAKGLDGGAAASTDAAEDEDSAALTGHGATLGSPHYMAPEQWEAPAGVDARADIYALGVLAYRCVSGHLPFKGVPRVALARAHLTMAPPPLPALVPAPIAAVIGRALAKPRDLRWPTALAFGDAMRGAIGGHAPEAVPILDPATREAWTGRGPQPIADAVARLARATTTVEADAALRELVAITCRWFAVLGLAQLQADGSYAEVRERARAVVGRDDAAPWLLLARAAAAAAPELPGLGAALAETGELEALAARLDDRDRPRTAAALASDVAVLPEALRPLERVLAYQLVVGRAGGAESWQGIRRRDRERVVVWGEPLADGEVALLDATGRVVSRLSPLVHVSAPLPSAEPELFLLWRSGRGAARLVAAPWGFERDDEAAAQRLNLLTTEDSDTLANAADDRSPYPGLAAYGVDDAERFVGREREIEALANRLIRAPMVAVLGPSGAGKSSFLHAGVLPRLAEHYEIITLRPGRHPLHALAALPAIHGDPDDRDGLVARLRTLGERAPRGLLIVIDQLEELVTLCADPGERDRFAATLAQAAADRQAPVRIVVTLRDDFATVIESTEGFRGRFEVFVLATPPPEALRRIVIEPARRAQVTVDPRVVEDMVAEVAGRPASLPLLSFTASLLWQARDRVARQITHDAYRALGGVAGALSSYADEVYGSLARTDQDVVRDLFSRLVSSDGTRIPVPRAELEQIRGAAGVLAHLIDARLLVVREDEGIDVVEIVHECLATRWDRLARWRSEDAADRALLGDVRAAARRWTESGRRADLLWHGEPLAELRKLTARSTALTETERSFAEEADRVARRARQLRRTLVVTAMALLGAVAIAMAYLGVAATRSQSAAERSAEEAQLAARLAEERLTTSLIAQGRRELNDGRALPALAYFGEALRRGADTPALRFMIAVASRGWRDHVRVVRGGLATAVAASSTGWIATADQQARIRFWGPGGVPGADLVTGLGWISTLQRTRDDRLLAVGRDGVAVIDPRTHQVVTTLERKAALSAILGPADDELAVIEQDAVRVFAADGTLRRTRPITGEQASSIPVFDPTGHHVTFGGSGDVETIDLTTMKARVLARDIEGVLAGSPDGARFGYIAKGGLAHVHAGDGTPKVTFKPEVLAHSLVFSEAGDRIGAVTEHELVIHDGAGKPLHGMTIKSSLAQFALRGDDAWIGDSEGVLRHFHEGHLLASQPDHLGEIRSLVIAGELAITLGGDGSLVMSRAGAAQLALHPRPCQRSSFGADGIAVSYTCGDEQHVYVGSQHVGTLRAKYGASVALDRASHRGAVSAEELVVFDAGKPVARTTSARGHLGAIAFEDREHLVVAESEGGRSGVWRWTIAEDRWDPIAQVAQAAAVAVAAGGIFVGTDAGEIVVLRDGREVRRVAVDGRVAFLTTSGDRRWVAATLLDGGTAILDGRTGTVTRRLEPADAMLAAATLDATGDLLIRSGRGTMTVWDRASGDALVFALDLLADMTNAAFAPDGRIEVAGRRIGVLDIPLERRDREAILRDIACKVPLRVRDGKLEPATATCPGEAAAAGPGEAPP